MHGQVIVEANTGRAHFLPGAEVSGTENGNGFAPGVMCENGFVEGKIVVPPSGKKKSTETNKEVQRLLTSNLLVSDKNLWKMVV